MNKNLGCLGYIGDEILPKYVWNIINDGTRIPIKQPLQWKVRVFFFRGSTGYSGFCEGWDR